MARRLVALVLLFVASNQAVADIPRGILRYRVGVAKGFGNPIGPSFIHGLDATLHLGSGARNWIAAVGWEIEWGCFGPWASNELAKFTICAGPANVDAVATSIKTVAARPSLILKRVLNEKGLLVALNAGLGVIRTNTPLLTNKRTYFTPAASLSLEQYWGGIVFSLTGHYQGVADRPKLGWLMLGIGYGG